MVAQQLASGRESAVPGTELSRSGTPVISLGKLRLPRARFGHSITLANIERESVRPGPWGEKLGRWLRCLDEPDEHPVKLIGETKYFLFSDVHGAESRMT